MIGLKSLLHELAFQAGGRLAIRRGRFETDIEKRVGAAMESVLRRRLDSDGQLWIESLERLRKRMLEEETTVTYSDFGAGGDSGVSGTITSPLRVVVRSSVPMHQGILLMELVRRLRPRRCIELGTCLGISAAYIAAGLDLNDNAGELETLEGGRDLARVASINFTQIGFERVRVVSGRFSDTLPKSLERMAPIDFAHIDGHHDGEATRQYFNAIMAHSASPAVVVLDDVRWSKSMRRAWADVNAHPNVISSYDLFVTGICIIDKNGQTKAGPPDHE